MDRHFLLGHPRALLILQASTLVLLVAILIPVLSGGKHILLLGGLLAGIGALWIIQKPHWGVLIILSSWFIKSDILFGIPYLVSAVLMIPLGLVVFRDRGSWLLGVPQIQIFLLIGFLFLISTWWSEFQYPITLFPQKDETIRQTREFITHLAWLVLFLYFVKTRETIELTVWLVLGLIVIAAISAVPEYLGGVAHKRAAAGFSFATNANRLAYICLFATSILWFYRFHEQTSRWKAWTLPTLLFLPMVTLAAGSRSGFLQLMLLTAFILKEQQGWSATKRAYSFLLFGTVGLLGLTLVPAAQLMRLTNFISPSVESTGGFSYHNRAMMVSEALDIIMTNPIFGIGIGNFKWVTHAFYPAGGEAHNSYLWALTSGGVGVFALYLLLFYVTYRMLRRLEKSGPRELLWLSKSLKVNLFMFCVFSAFADFWLSDFLYVLVGLTIAMTYFWKREQQRLALIRPGKDLTPYLK